MKHSETDYQLNGEASPPLPLPRSAMRHLVLGNGIQVGSRVWVLGGERGEFVRYFDYLGIEATALDDSQPLGDEQLASSRGRFDMILVRNHPAFRRNLYSVASREQTARLLACLRPQGTLLVLDRAAHASSKQVQSHRDSCFQQHLSCFPGQYYTWRPSEGFSMQTTWNRLLKRQPRPRYRFISFRTPEDPVSLNQWLESARSHSALSDVCCSWGRQNNDPSAKRAA